MNSFSSNQVTPTTTAKNGPGKALRQSVPVTNISKQSVSHLSSSTISISNTSKSQISQKKATSHFMSNNSPVTIQSDLKNENISQCKPYFVNKDNEEDEIKIEKFKKILSNNPIDLGKINFMINFYN